MSYQAERRWVFVVNTQTDAISKFGFTSEGLKAFLFRHPHMRALVAFPQYGAFFTVIGFKRAQVLMHSPMLANGEADRTNFGEVTALPDRTDTDAAEFCEAINKVFGSKFTPREFAGR